MSDTAATLLFGVMVMLGLLLFAVTDIAGELRKMNKREDAKDTLGKQMAENQLRHSNPFGALIGGVHAGESHKDADG